MLAMITVPSIVERRGVKSDPVDNEIKKTFSNVATEKRKTKHRSTGRAELESPGKNGRAQKNEMVVQ
jgi:hypothetical protein